MVTNRAVSLDVTALARHDRAYAMATDARSAEELVGDGWRVKGVVAQVALWEPRAESWPETVAGKS